MPTAMDSDSVPEMTQAELKAYTREQKKRARAAEKELEERRQQESTRGE